MDLEELPEELTLKPSKLKWIGVLAIGAIFTTLGIFIVSKDGDVMGWLCTIFFGLVAGIALAQLVGNSYLRLHADGFEQNMLGRKLDCRWEEVSNFGIFRTKGNSFVTFNRAQDEGKLMAKVNQAVGGGSAQLGDTFGMSAEALATLMLRFQERSLSRSQNQDGTSTSSQNP